MTPIEESFYKLLKSRIDIAYMSITKGVEELQEVVRDIPVEWREEFAEYVAKKDLIVLSRERYEDAIRQAKEEE